VALDTPTRRAGLSALVLAIWALCDCVASLSTPSAPSGASAEPGGVVRIALALEAASGSNTVSVWLCV
jgi:hypothetical protein